MPPLGVVGVDVLWARTKVLDRALDRLLTLEDELLEQERVEVMAVVGKDRKFWHCLLCDTLSPEEGIGADVAVDGVCPRLGVLMTEFGREDGDSLRSFDWICVVGFVGMGGRTTVVAAEEKVDGTIVDAVVDGVSVL